MRKIIHMDMDAFYAAVEQRDDPRLRGRALAVAGQSPRSVVLTASYEARHFGVRSAMPVFKALKLCPELVTVRPRFDAYREASGKFRDILLSVTDIIEPLSLDEAYLDVTDQAKIEGSATQIAQQIRQHIFAETGLTASAGISFNKFLAKLASDVRKPDGYFVIRPEQAMPFLADLPIGKFHGIGPSTARKLSAIGIDYGRDLQALNETQALQTLGEMGLRFWHLAHGDDEREVGAPHKRQSVSVETTFDKDVMDLNILQDELEALAAKMMQRCGDANFSGRTLTLKIKTSDFRSTTRSHSLLRDFSNIGEVQQLANWLLMRETMEKPVRLLGLGVSKAASKDRDQRQIELPFKYSHSGEE